MRPRTLARGLAFGAPLVAFVLTCSAHAYWLDSGEFVAASIALDIAHPPGHPLSLLYGKAFSLLPLGSLPLRIALGQAFATALASYFVCRAIAAMLSALDLDERVVALLALFGSWASALSYALWFQAVRPEVYALQTLCMSVVIERVCVIEARQLRGAGALLAVALALALGLANHHLIALLVVPALLPTVWRVARAHGLRPLALACAAGALGLLTYVYLPLRAAANPVMNLGDPRTASRLFWVVSAKVYARDMGNEAPQPMMERFVDVIVLAIESLQAWVVITAALGLYLGLRHSRTRRHATFLGLLVLVGLGVRAWLGPVRANPDILGYLGPAFVGIGMLSCLGLALVVELVVKLVVTRRPSLARFATVGAVCLPLAVLVGFPQTRARASLARFDATDVFDDLRVRELPARAVLVATAPQTVFRKLELDVVEAVRPDVALVDLPFLRYPKRAEALLRVHPDLAGVVRGYLVRDELRPRDLEQLAARRPTYVELDTRVDPATYRALLPEGLLHRARAARFVLSERTILDERSRAYDELYARLGDGLAEQETSRQMLWVHYVNALYFASAGSPGLARFEIERALRLAPADADLQALLRALPAPGTRQPLDVRPLLPEVKKADR